MPERVLVTSSGRTWSVPARDVRQIVPAAPMLRDHLTPPGLAGIMHVGRDWIGVIDLAPRLAGERAQSSPDDPAACARPAPDGLILITTHDDRKLALGWRIDGIDVESDSVTLTGDLSGESPDSVAAKDHHLDLAGLIHPDEWRAIETWHAAMKRIVRIAAALDRPAHQIQRGPANGLGGLHALYETTGDWFALPANRIESIGPADSAIDAGTRRRGVRITLREANGATRAIDLPAPPELHMIDPAAIVRALPRHVRHPGWPLRAALSDGRTAHLPERDALSEPRP
jgi:hypothetical protein